MRRELDFSDDAGSPKSKSGVVYMGIDGEGIGRRPHRYVLLAAAEEPITKAPSRHWWTENVDGLSTLDCLRFITNLPRRIGRDRVQLFAYSFGYDLTKILQGLDNERLYRLFRPDRRGKVGHEPAAIHFHGYELNYLGNKFTVRGPDGYKTTVWDIWKFYQGKFVDALKDWKVGTGETVEETERMKALRNRFRPEDMPEIRTYCFSECRDMATLAHKLVTAHEEAGLKLTTFYGAGSTASAMLKVMGIREKLRPPSEEMKEAVASAFFGGRFENSVIGCIERSVYNFDISSAYPYQTCFLPCLVHGKWERTTRREDLDGARQACVEYKLGCSPRGEIKDWGPLPYRMGNGSICFPSESGGGWVWMSEYLAAERFCEVENPYALQFVGAWVLRSDCDCQPFKDMPHYYRERIRIGKEGAGIVFKLGPNSAYGKLAQSVGSARYQSWIYAGMITSGCRGQLLDMVTLHHNRRNALMVATDGIFTCEPIAPPLPRDTDTWGTKKPLGGWERGDIPQGIFAARPGIYFPLNPTKDDIKKVKGRGVGKGTILENHAMIVQAYRDHGIEKKVTVKDIERFCGAKTSISYGASTGIFTRASGGLGKKGQELPMFGEWVKRRVEMDFNPMPKRAAVMADGVHLALRKMPLDVKSEPYRNAMKSPEARLLEAATEEMYEQPDGDLSELYEPE